MSAISCCVFLIGIIVLMFSIAFGALQLPIAQYVSAVIGLTVVVLSILCAIITACMKNKE